jgi:diguanylate cyclase (GGDEF)-like protein/PAS domain S-box-containing protein
MPRLLTIRLSSLKSFAILAFAYMACAIASIQLVSADSRLATLWIANIIVFAILMRNEELRGPASLTGIFVGCVAANLIKGSSLPASGLFGIISAVYIGLLMHFAVKLLAKEDNATNPVRAFVAVLAAFMAITCTAASLLGAAATVLLQWSFVPTASQWLINNIGTAAIFLPFALLVSRQNIMTLAQPKEALQALVWSVICCGVMWISLDFGSFPFAYAMIPMLAAAVRLPKFDLAIVCMATGLCSLFSAANGYAENVAGIDGQISIGFQFAVAINVIMPFLASLLIDQIQESVRKVAETEERYRQAANHSDVGMLNIDMSGRIIETNPAFAGLLGYAPAEMQGRRVHEFTPVEDLHIGNDVIAAAKRGEMDAFTFQKRYSRRDGTRVWVEISASVMRSQETGEPIYLISQMRDISARKKAEAALAEMEDRWDFALASVGQGFWDHNVVNGKVTYSTTWTSMLGYEPGELNGDADSWIGRIHPDDLPIVQAMDANHQTGLIPAFQLEYRMRHKAGHWMWVLDRGKIIERAKDGSPVRLIGTLTDISMRKQAEEELAHTAALLAEEKERLRVTLNSIGDAVICIDAEDRITFMNPIAELMTGVPAKHGVGQALTDVYLAIEDERSHEAHGSAMLDDRFKSSWQNLAIVRSDGSRRAIREVTSPILNEKGDSSGRVIVFQDFTDLRAMQRELAHAAAHDLLTGLANRSRFLAELDDMIENRHGKEQHQLLYVDLDRFKTVNDSGGHSAGDELLQKIAVAIKASVRGLDFVARLGGDEFGVILRSCPPAYARIAAQKIIDTISSLRFEWNATAYTVGASIGIATIDENTRSVEAAIERADHACYAAYLVGTGCSPR